jgi:hypothetical protein
VYTATPGLNFQNLILKAQHKNEARRWDGINASTQELRSCVGGVDAAVKMIALCSLAPSLSCPVSPVVGVQPGTWTEVWEGLRGVWALGHGDGAWRMGSVSS